MKLSSSVASSASQSTTHDTRSSNELGFIISKYHPIEAVSQSRSTFHTRAGSFPRSSLTHSWVFGAVKPVGFG